MADNAIEKLFEEMRAANQELDAARAERESLRGALTENEKRLETASSREKMLQNTLHKHIHEGIPVVQAKMIAHEEHESQPTFVQMSNISAGSIKSNSYTFRADTFKIV